MPRDGDKMREEIEAPQAAVYRDGRIELEGPVCWPEGARLLIVPAERACPREPAPAGTVIIAGFGLPGRCVADCLEQRGIGYVIVESNPATVEIQRTLGRKVVEGDVTDESVLRQAGITEAVALALTVPDEAAVLKATELARKLNPNIYIIARTNYASSGMEATRLGADDVVKAEQAVAFQFYEKIKQHLLST